MLDDQVRFGFVESLQNLSPVLPQQVQELSIMAFLDCFSIQGIPVSQHSGVLGISLVFK